MGTKFIVQVCYAEGRERVKFANGASAIDYAKQHAAQPNVKKVELKDCATSYKEVWSRDSNGNVFITVSF